MGLGFKRFAVLHWLSAVIASKVVSALEAIRLYCQKGL